MKKLIKWLAKKIKKFNLVGSGIIIGFIFSYLLILTPDAIESYQLSLNDTIVSGKYIDTGNVNIYLPIAMKNGDFVVYGSRMSPKTALRASIHELGHHIWESEMNDELKQEYAQAYNSTNSYVTEYAKTKVEEDFAENLAASVSCSIDLKKIPKDRREFFRLFWIFKEDGR